MPLVEKIGDPAPVEELDRQGQRQARDQDRCQRAAATAPGSAAAPRGQAGRQAQGRSDRRNPEEGGGRSGRRRRRPRKRPRPSWKRRKQQPKFDPTQIAALLDKREPQRQAAAGETLVPVPWLGVSDRPCAHACRRPSSTRCARG